MRWERGKIKNKDADNKRKDKKIDTQTVNIERSGVGDRERETKSRGQLYRK